MKTKPVAAKSLVLKPGDIEGKRGCTTRRHSTEHWVYNEHFDENGNRVGLECISSKEHWWLDTEIRRPPLRDEDWIMEHYFDQHPSEDWQVPWAWDYECWREWQPWSDFGRWREKFLQEVERLKSVDMARLISSPGIPFWIFNSFADLFLETPWTAIPDKEREMRLKKENITPSTRREPLPHLEGSVRTLKKGAPKIKGIGDDEGMRALQDWQDAPGHYDEEKLETIKGYHRARPGSNETAEEICVVDYIGTYVIRVPWHYPDDVLDQAWKAWRTRHKPKEQKPDPWMNGSGKRKTLDWLRQLGALRLLRVMSATEAITHTEKILEPNRDESRPLYPHRSRWTEARQNANRLLARYFGVG
jgi:hypothetical protein